MNNQTQNLKVYQPSELEKQLKQREKPIEFFYFENLDSTHDFLLSKVDEVNHQSAVCITEYQTKGRGRFNRKWLAEPFSQMTLSFLTKNQTPIKNFQLLSIACTLESLLALEKLGFEDIKIKWPNDLYFNKNGKNQKLAGILIDSQVFKNQSTLVIGLGLNLNPFNLTHHDSTHRPASLEQINPEQLKKLTKNQIAISLIDAIELALTELIADNQLKYIKLFNQYDLLRQQKIQFKQVDDEVIEGINLGINQNGQLIIDSEIKKYQLNQGQIVLSQSI